MKIRLFIIITVWFSISLTGVGSMGICTESKGQIFREGTIRKGYLRKGDPIYHGDRLQVANNSFLSLNMIFEKVMISLYDNTIIKIFQNEDETTLYNEIALFGGKVIVQMEEGYDTKFVLNAPSAIATAFDAHFLVEYKDDIFFDNPSYSIITLLKGKMEIKNTVSGDYIYLKEGQTMVSTIDGKFLQLDTFRNKSIIPNTINNYRF